MTDDRSPEILAAMRADYEGRVIKIAEMCRRYEVTRRRLYVIASAEGWRLRSPKRVDKNDLTQRLLRLLEQQVQMFEETMTKTPIDQTAVLSKLSATLDRLIATDRETSPAPRRTRDSKMVRDIRNKVAERLSRLKGE
jgi:hypothetical protein